MGAIEALELPGILIFLRRQNPTGPVAGSVINHLGLKVRKLDDLMARFQAAGTPVEKPVIGREHTPQTYVTGPDEFRMELVEDPSLKTPVASHHLHYFLAEPALAKEWYTRYLLVKPGMRGPYEAGDVPGMNLTFAPLRTGRGGGATVGTKSRVLDHIGFDVTHLNEFRRRLEQSGIKFDQPDQQTRDEGMAAAFFTDPWGTYIELTEGLNRLR
jgi:hypothetical protein